MRGGTLRNKVTIQRRTQTPDSMGGFVDEWQDYTTAYAQINRLKAREEIEDKRIQLKAPHVIWIRYQTGITPDMRITWNDRTFDIVSIRNPEERGRTLEIMADEVVQ